MRPSVRRVAATATRFLCRRDRPREAPGLGGFSSRHHLVFHLRQGRQQLARFKWLDDVIVGADAAAFFGLERFQLAHRQEHGDVSCLGCVFQPLADFQPAVAGHVYIQHDQIRLDFGNTLEGRRSIVNRDDVITGIGQDLSPHVLGCHTVIGEQNFPSQDSSFGT